MTEGSGLVAVQCSSWLVEIRLVVALVSPVRVLNLPTRESPLAIFFTRASVEFAASFSKYRIIL